MGEFRDVCARIADAHILTLAQCVKTPTCYHEHHTSACNLAQTLQCMIQHTLTPLCCMMNDVQEAAAKLAEENRVAEAEAARIKAEQQKQKEEEVRVFFSKHQSVHQSVLLAHCNL
jgi:hypothetical protein